MPLLSYHQKILKWTCLVWFVTWTCFTPVPLVANKKPDDCQKALASEKEDIPRAVRDRRISTITTSGLLASVILLMSFMIDKTSQPTEGQIDSVFHDGLDGLGTLEVSFSVADSQPSVGRSVEPTSEATTAGESVNDKPEVSPSPPSSSRRANVLSKMHAAREKAASENTTMTLEEPSVEAPTSTIVTRDSSVSAVTVVPVRKAVISQRMKTNANPQQDGDSSDSVELAGTGDSSSDSEELSKDAGSGKGGTGSKVGGSQRGAQGLGTGDGAGEGVGEGMGEGDNFSDVEGRLSRAGAQTGDVQISLAWNNGNDLDLHVQTPGGEEICYFRSESTCGGKLDVDMNVGGPKSETPVENVFWPVGGSPKGHYRVLVRHFATYGGSDPTLYQITIKIKGVEKKYTGTVSFGLFPQMANEFDVE